MSSNFHVATGGEGNSTDASPGLDEASFTELYAAHRDALVRFCSARAHDQARVEDIVQDVFEKAFVRRARFQAGRDFWPWLASIAARTCIDAHRRAVSAEARNEQYGRDAYREPFDVTSHTVLRQFDQQQLGERIAALPARQRAALGLFALDGWSYDDIAEHLGDSVSAVKALLCRARASLRDSSWHGLAAAFGVGRTAWRRAQHRLARMQAWMWPGCDSWGPVAGSVATATPLVVVAAVVAGLFVPADGDATTRPGAGTAALTGGLRVPSPVGQGHMSATSAVAAARVGHRPLTAEAERAGNDVAHGLLPNATTAADDPEHIRTQSFAMSPHYEDDPTVFLAGWLGGNRVPVMVLLLATHDGGTSWERRRATGLAPVVRLLLPPSYPRDHRLFAVTLRGLQVSHDGGETFETLVTLPGITDAAISPRFDTDDPSILLVAGERLWSYADDTGDLAPVELLGTPATHRVVSVAHAADGPGRPVVVLGSRSVDDLLLGATPYVNRCTGGPTASNLRARPLDCEGVRLPRVAGRLSLRLPSSTQSGVIYMPGTLPPLVSTDNGRSFRSVYATSDPSTPRSGTVTFDDLAVVPGSGGASAVAAQMGSTPLARTDDFGRTWASIPVGLPRFEAGSLVVVTPSGRIIAASLLGEIGCSEDGGRTWARLCPTPDRA